jgi:hypothetical protein
MLCLLLAACQRGQGPAPTPIGGGDASVYATELAETAAAPPIGFQTVSFPLIDANLNNVEGWQYRLSVQFTGTFARTSRPTDALTELEVSYNRMANARRVVLRSGGQLLEEPSAYEAVRLGDSAYLVQDSACVANVTDQALEASNLGAGLLIGGVTTATPTGRSAILNNAQAWEYTFTADALTLGSIQLGDGGSISAARGELWVAPSFNAVVRYYAIVTVDNVVLFGAALPVSGEVQIRYDANDLGTPTNIAIPFGC